MKINGLLNDFEFERYKKFITEQQLEVVKIRQNKLLVPRNYLEEYPEMLKTDLLKIIMGVRRTGKSVLAIQSFPENQFVYINFDDERLMSLEAKDLEVLHEAALWILPNCKKFVLDEIQNIEGWELFANRLRKQGYDLVITGSNSKLLSSELSTHLTGRHYTCELFPFSFSEYLSVKHPNHEFNTYLMENRITLEKCFEDYLITGGFPELSKEIPIGPYLRELFDKIVMRDIVARRSVRNVKTFKEISKYVIGAYGNRLTFQSLKKLFGLNSIQTIKNYLEYLEEAYLIFIVNPFSYKAKERISLPKKIYSIDPALSNAVTPGGVFDDGRKLENIVYLEFRRRKQEIYYHIDPKSEIDFLLVEGRKVKSLIQVCYSLKDIATRERELKALAIGAKMYKCSNLLIITRDENDDIKWQDLKIKIISITSWLLKYETSKKQPYYRVDK